MAITYTDAANAPPSDAARDASHDDWLDDGEAMHSLFARDLPTQLNNLASYCQPWPQYVQTCDTTASGVLSISPTVAGEYLVFQFPLVVPIGALRMFWTAGMERIGPRDSRVKGSGVKAIRRPAPDPVVANGLQGIEQLRLAHPPGRARVTLFTEDPGEWEDLPAPLQRRIRINGSPPSSMGSMPTWRKCAAGSSRCRWNLS